jgi:hypothetical protein
MSFFSADTDDLKALYIVQLQRALDLENKLVEIGLPALAAAATDPQLLGGLKNTSMRPRVR